MPSKEKGSTLNVKWKHTVVATLVVVPLAAMPFLGGVAFASDTDGDGVADEDDRCVAEVGQVQHLGCAKPVPLESKITRPDSRVTVRVRHWRPWATPTTRQVMIILREEQDRWGGPWLGNRVACESGYSWSATNGQYAGLLQFGSIWSSMWPGTPRGVKYVSTEKKRKPIVRHTLLTSGEWTHRKIGSVRQKKTVIRKGRLPRNPDAYHGWAAIRVGQRAVSGDGLTTSWACGL